MQILCLIFLSIAFLALPFLHYQLGWVTPICLLPFLSLLYRLEKSKTTNRQIVFTIWFVGFCSFLIILGWSLQTNPQKWAFIDGWQANVALIITYLGLCFFFSLQYIMFAWLFIKLRVKLLDSKILLVLPSIWVVSEFFRSCFFSIVVSGQGGSFGPFWNFGVLGVASSVTPLGYAARLVGLFGLSALIVFFNTALFLLARKKNWRLLILATTLIVALPLLGYGLYARSTNTIQKHVAFVQLSQQLDEGPSDKTLTESILDSSKNQTKQADVVVLPEYSELFSYQEADTKPTGVDVAQKLGGSDGILITSVQSKEDDDKRNNRLAVYDSSGQVIAEIDKTFLIPIGEYMPYFHQGLLWLLNQRDTIEMNKATREITKGKSEIHTLIVHGISLAAQACSGAIAPEFYRNEVKQGGQLLTNSANLGMFSGAPTYHAQSRQFARFIAIANARPYVQAANGAYSYIIDQNGAFVVRTTKLGYGFGEADIMIGGMRTLYSVFGEWVVAVSFVALILFYCDVSRRLSKDGKKLTKHVKGVQ